MNEHETSVHIYRYSMEKDDMEETFSFHAQRIQELHVPYDLNRCNLFYAAATGELTLDICKMELANGSSEACMSFAWNDADVDGGNFKAQLEPSIVDKWVKMSAIDDMNELSKFKMDDAAVFLQYKVV